MNAATPPAGEKVSLPLRIWIFVEILFGVAAVLSVGLVPQDTAQNFAWPIQAVATAAILGGFYISVSTVFAVALFVRRWPNLRVFVPAAILFTSAELLATFLHWDKFTVGTTPFYVWFASYLLPPPIFLALYIRQQRSAPPIPQPDDQPLAPALRILLLLVGAALTIVAVAVFIDPPLLIPNAPVAFTPLTARAFSGWVLALGIMHLAAARENDRARVRVVSPFFILLLPVLGLQLARFADQVAWTSISFVVAAAVLAIVCLTGIQLARGDWRRTMS